MPAWVDTVRRFPRRSWRQPRGHTADIPWFQAPPIVVQTVAFTETVATSSDTKTVAATGAGNLLMLAINVRSNTLQVSSITDTGGNTWRQAFRIPSGSTASLEVWTTVDASPASVTSVTVNLTGAISHVFRIWEISGANNLYPIDVWKGTGSTSTGTAANSGLAVLPRYAGQLAFGAIANDYGSSARTYSAGTFTQAAPATSWPAATTGDSSAVTGSSGSELHTGDLAITTQTQQAYSATISTASWWAAAVWLLNSPGPVNPPLVDRPRSRNSSTSWRWKPSRSRTQDPPWSAPGAPANPAFVDWVRRGTLQRFWPLPRRARLAVPGWGQAASTNPTIVLVTIRRRSPVTLTRRARISGTPLVSDMWLPTSIRRTPSALIARRSRTQVTIGGAATVPECRRLRRRADSPRRAQLASLPWIVPVPPKWPPTWSRRQGGALRIWRQPRTFQWVILPLTTGPALTGLRFYVDDPEPASAWDDIEPATGLSTNVRGR